MGLGGTHLPADFLSIYASFILYMLSETNIQRGAAPSVFYVHFQTLQISFSLQDVMHVQVSVCWSKKCACFVRVLTYWTFSIAGTLVIILVPQKNASLQLDQRTVLGKNNFQ